MNTEAKLHPMSKYPPRPTLTADIAPAVLLTAAKAIETELVRWMNWTKKGKGIAEQIAQIPRASHLNGYELARHLEDRHGYRPDLELIEVLDGYSDAVKGIIEAAEKAWATAEAIEPPWPIGSRITEGVITGIYEYGAARYRVKENGCTDENRSLIIKFEDAHLA